MSRTWKHLTADGVQAIHGQVLAAHGGGEGLRDLALLESAVAAPQATWGGEPILDDPYEIAAAYLFYLCRNHPFVDGNKRVALATCLTFLVQNEVWTIERLAVDDWEALTLDVAASRLDRDQTTQRLQALLAAPGKPGRGKTRKRPMKRRA